MCLGLSFEDSLGKLLGALPSLQPVVTFSAHVHVHTVYAMHSSGNSDLLDLFLSPPVSVSLPGQVVQWVYQSLMHLETRLYCRKQ